MRPLISLLILFSATSCRSTGDLAESKVLSLSAPSVIFQKPECLPGCTATDQAKLTENSLIEREFITAIKAAKHDIEFSQFTFSRKPIFDALSEASARGVRVRGIMDRAQLKGSGTNSDKLAVALNALPNGSGVKTAPGKDRLVHNKFAIIDREILLTGSGNWSSTAVSVNLENLTKFTSLDQPEILKSYGCMFDLVWKNDPDAIAKEMPGCQIKDKTYFSPAARQGAGPQDAVLNSIDSAKQQIDIAMHHLVDPDSLAALGRAKSRGVTVRIAVDDDDCNMTEDVLTKLESDGVEIRYVPTSCKIFQLSHSKYGVFDNAIVINGSGNWSRSGLTRNYENFFKSAELAPAFSDHFNWLWTHGQTKAQCQCDRTKPECVAKYCLDQQR